MEDVELENKSIADEYRVWKKNAPFLYDLVLTHALTWPSLTCSWLPTLHSPPNADYTVQELLLGTHTSGAEQNFVIVASVRIPKPMADVDPSKFVDETGEFGGYGNASDNGRIEFKQMIPHDGEVNRARCAPANPNMIATKSPSGDVLVFDKTKHPSNLDGTTKKVAPQLRLKGHTKEGYGLDWNPHSTKVSYLLSGSDDGLVCVWDVDHVSQDAMPLHAIGVHVSNVEDVAWHRVHDDLFGSCGDDHHLYVWDLRSKPMKPTIDIVVSAAECNCLSFSPYNENYVLAGSADRAIRLYDLRNTREPIYTAEGVHRDQVLAVQWCPFQHSVFASSGADRRVMLWDLRLTGAEQSAEDAADGPAELLFVHGGHTSRVCDFGWNPCPGGEWMLASTAEDNILQIWQIAENIYQDVDEAVVPNAEIGEQ